MTGDRCGLPGWCLYVTEQWAICTRDSPFIHSNNNAAVEAQNYTERSARAPVKTLVVRSMKMILQHWPVQHSCSIWLQFVPSVKAFLKKNKRISLGFTKNRANSYSTSLRTLLRWDDQEIINLSDSIAPGGRNLHKPVSLFTQNMRSMFNLRKHVQQTSNTRLPCNYRSECRNSL